MEDVAWCGISVRVYLVGSIGFEKLGFREIILEVTGSRAMVTIGVLKKKSKLDRDGFEKVNVGSICRLGFLR